MLMRAAPCDLLRAFRPVSINFPNPTPMPPAIPPGESRGKSRSWLTIVSISFLEDDMFC